MLMKAVYEIRWHGRGGQGVVTVAQLLAEAAVREGKYAIAIPYFGAERRGAPVVASNRISDKPIRSRSSVKEPDVVVVLDPNLPFMVDVTEGLREGGLLVINAPSPNNLPFKGLKAAVVDATGIALSLGLKLAGLALVNMPMLGALIRATSIVSLESITAVVKNRWSRRVGELNVKGIIEAYNKVQVVNL